MLDSMLKRKEYSNTGKYVFPGIAYDCSLNWYRRFLKSAGNGRVHKKRVSYLYRTATTTYPCLIPHLGESVGAGRIRLTPAQKYEFFVSLQRKKELSAILSLFFESRMPKRLPGCVSEGGAGRVNERIESRRKQDCLSCLLLRLQSGQRWLWFSTFSFSEMPSGSGATLI